MITRLTYWRHTLFNIAMLPVCHMTYAEVGVTLLIQLPECYWFLVTIVDWQTKLKTNFVGTCCWIIVFQLAIIFINLCSISLGWRNNYIIVTNICIMRLNLWYTQISLQKALLMLFSELLVAQYCNEICYHLPTVHFTYLHNFLFP